MRGYQWSGEHVSPGRRCQWDGQGGGNQHSAHRHPWGHDDDAVSGLETLRPSLAERLRACIRGGHPGTFAGRAALIQFNQLAMWPATSLAPTDRRSRCHEQSALSDRSSHSRGRASTSSWERS
jgi:hypothetical protein